VKKLSLLGLALLLGSCAPFYWNFEGYKINHVDLEEAWQKASSLAYQADKGDYWKSPHETLSDGGGDCEDISIYLMYLLGPESSLVLFDYPGTTQCHAIVLYRGQYIDALIYNFLWDESQVKYTWYQVYDFDETMRVATKYGTMSVRAFEN
jgi:hypothetical protein